MFINRETFEQLTRLAAQSEFLTKALKAAEKRAEDAENALAAERQRHDWKDIQLLNRAITKHGGYGLDHEPKPVAPEPHPKGFIHDPSEIDLAKLEFYKQSAVAAGFPEEHGEMKWEREMRGEGLQMESEVEQ